MLTPKQAKNLIPINPAPLSHLLDINHDDVIEYEYVNTFLKMSKSEETIETFWIPTPEETGYETQHAPNAANRPKRCKTEICNHPKDNSYKPGTSAQNARTSILKNPLN